MNSNIYIASKYAYHTFTNVEFTGVFDKISYMQEYFHIFIKYGDKVYMDVGISNIVISFDELQKNKYWKYYYDLSLMLTNTNDKHMIVQDLNENYSYNRSPKIYDDTIFWTSNTSFINGCLDIQTKKGYYYKINPYDLENMEYTSPQDLNNFTRIYTTTNGIIRFGLFEENYDIYNNLAIDYQINMMKKELDELSEYFEDKKNVMNLVYLYDIYNKKDINYDVLMMIYNYLVSSDGNKRYKSIIDELETHNKLESIANIIVA